MSQLAAALAPYIAIPKKGLVSARNQFIAKNISNATFAENTASIDLATLQLTIGSVYLPEIGNVTVGAGGVASVALSAAAAANIESVVYIVGKKGANDELSIIDSKAVSTPGDGRTFQTTVDTQDADCVIWAYGLTTVNGGARTNYGDYEAEPTDDVASLLASRSVAIASGNLTKTVGKIVN